MPKDIKLTVFADTGEVFKDRTCCGINGENLQGNIIVEFKHGFIDGTAYLEINRGKDDNGNDDKGFIKMEKVGESYQLPIKSSLLCKTCLMELQIRIAQTSAATGGQIPVFKSRIFELKCRKAINAVESIPEQYPQWVDSVDKDIAYLKEAIGGGGYDSLATKLLQKEVDLKVSYFTFEIPEEYSNVSIYFYYIENATYIDWSDGTIDDYTDSVSGNKTHTYAKGGKYVVKVYDATTFFNETYYSIPTVTSGKEYLTEIVYGDYVKKFSFNGLQSLKRLVLPKLVEDLSKTEFYNLSLTQLVFPKNINVYANSLIVNGLTNLHTIVFESETLPQAVSFSNLPNIKKIFVPNGKVDEFKAVVGETLAGKVDSIAYLSDLLNLGLGDLDLSEYVKFTDIATALNPGVVKVIASRGISIDKDALRLEVASEKLVKEKEHGVYPLTPKYIDLITKLGVTSNAITLTDEEKAEALAWLGTARHIVVDLEQLLYSQDMDTFFDLSRKAMSGEISLVVSFIGYTATPVVSVSDGFARWNLTIGQSLDTFSILIVECDEITLAYKFKDFDIASITDNVEELKEQIGDVNTVLENILGV